MLRKRLAASVAAAPLMLIAPLVLAAPIVLTAGVAHADTTISTAQTTPVATATANAGAPDNVIIGAAGSVKPTAAGAAVTLNSNNTVTNQGAVGTTGVDNSTGILVQGGFTGAVTNSAVISLDETYTPTDTNGDGNLDGAYAQGTGRYGVRVTGPFTGPISNTVTGSVTVEGNNSAGISVEGPLTGAFNNSGTVTVTGNSSYGIHLADVIGDVRIQGTVSVLGQGTTGVANSGATAVALDGDVTGAVVFQGTVSATGYRYTSRPVLATDRANLGADDGVDHPTGSAAFNPDLFSGPAVRIAGNVTGGVLFDVAPIISTSTTLDGDGDGIVDANDTDQDNDGVADTTETNASIASIGGAPAVQIGSATQAVTLGVVGTGDYNYGLVSRGAIAAAGIYDGVNATGVQIGTAAGQPTIVTNGANFIGSVTVSAYEANATGVHLMSGAQADTLQFGGATSITGVSDANVIANRGADGNTDATAVLIDSGASVTTVRNTGTVNLVGQGEGVNTVFVRDLSGSVRLVENIGKVNAGITATDDASDTTDADTDAGNEVINGKKIAVDVQAATGNVVVRQAAPATHISTDTTDANHNGVYDADEPSMVGDVLFGAHDDRLELLSGTLVGDISFGAGADTLVMNGASKAGGALSDSDGNLDIQMLNGSLTITNADTIAGTNLSMSSSSAITFTADPGANHVTRLDMGTADIAAGARIGLRFTSLLGADERFTVIHAGTLSASTLNEDLLGNSPYLYVTHAGVDIANGDVFVDVSRRTAADIGLNKQGSAAYDAIYNALYNDTAIRDAFLTQTTRAGFMGQFDQMLPNQGAGVFSALMLAGQSTSDGIAARPDPHQRYGPDSFWIQEINSRIQRDTSDTEGSDTKTFGFVSGYESMGDGGALGLTLSYVSAEERGSSAQVGEQTDASLWEAGAYWRGYQHNLTYSVRGSAGYVRLNSDRRFVYAVDTNGDGLVDTTAINRTASANWSGYTFSAGGDVAYEARMGRFYARPSVGVDYLYFSEGGYSESGGGAGFDLSVAGRKSSRLDVDAMLALGAEFGRESWWRPEVRVGYRQRVAGQLGDTIARFSGGSPFTSSVSGERNGALVVGFSLKSGTPMSYLTLEGDSELSAEEMRYLLRLVGRVMF